MSNSILLDQINLSFNLLSAILDIIALVICLIFILILVYRFYGCIRHRRQRIIIDVPLILSINMICWIIFKSSLQLRSITIPILMVDFHLNGQSREIYGCQIFSYLFWSISGILFWNYALFAFYRFVRVLYPSRTQLVRLSFYICILLPSIYILNPVSLLPILLISKSFQLIPNEFYCDILITHRGPMIYSSLAVYMTPVSFVCIFYFFIIRKIHQSVFTNINRARNRRDYEIVRRIFYTILILSAAGTPSMIVYIVSLFYSNWTSVFYRLERFSSSTASFLLSIALPWITTHLYKLFKSKRIQPTNAR